MTTNEMLRWLPDPERNANEAFEDIADWFYAETHTLRPGKDDISGETIESRTRIWEDWRMVKAIEFRDAVRSRATMADELAAALGLVWGGVSDYVQDGLDGYSSDEYIIVTPIPVGGLKKIRAALVAYDMDRKS
jgi:hypothetical protein